MSKAGQQISLKRNEGLLQKEAAPVRGLEISSSAKARLTYSAQEAVRHLRKAAQPDYWPTEGWRTAAPEAHGIDSAGLAKAVKEVKDQNLHSFVLVRNGYIVAEGYSKEWDEDRLHPMYSVTKSFTAAACGMAIGEELLTGVGHKLGEFYPEIQHEQSKAEITVEQLLSMSSGLEWDNRGERSSVEMADSPDWVQYVLDRHMRFQPGSAFQYNNGNAHLLSGLLQRAIGIPVNLYVHTKLFVPMGIRNPAWGGDLQGVAIGSWALRIRSRDMAKFGLLYLQGGQWEGGQLIPSSWVEASIQPCTSPSYADGTEGGYGYFWWLKPFPSSQSPFKAHSVFYAAGSGGQRIFVVPDLNLVLAVTGSNQKNGYMPEQFLEKLLRAVKSDAALPVNEKAEAQLRASVGSLKRTVDKPVWGSL